MNDACGNVNQRDAGSDPSSTAELDARSRTGQLSANSLRLGRESPTGVTAGNVQNQSTVRLGSRDG